MNQSSVKLGTLSGTLLTILANISWIEIGRTVVLGAIGATVSFLVSLFLKKIIHYGKDLRERSIKPQVEISVGQPNPERKAG